MVCQYSPEFIRALEDGNRFVMPAKVLTTVATKGHTPAVSWKPCMSLGGWTVSNCTRAGIKGVKVAFYPSGICKKVSASSTYAKKPVRVCDQAAGGNALINFGTVAANCV
jgi:hypothetical protein